MVEIAKFLYHNDGYMATSFEMKFSSAAACGPLELVEVFCADARCNASLVNRGFKLAAGGGQLAVMKLFQSKEGFDSTELDKAFVKAAGNGQVDILEHFYSDEAFRPLGSSFDEATVVAGDGGHLKVVKFLGSRGKLSDELAVKVFMSAAKDEGLKDAEIDDQTGVLSFLYAKGCISSDVIIKFFPESASCSCVEVVEFLLHRSDPF